jgi:hypothetical protein
VKVEAAPRTNQVHTLGPSETSCSGLGGGAHRDADGEVLLALLKHLAVFYNLMPRWQDEGRGEGRGGKGGREGGREGGNCSST